MRAEGDLPAFLRLRIRPDRTPVQTAALWQQCAAPARHTEGAWPSATPLQAGHRRAPGEAARLPPLPGPRCALRGRPLPLPPVRHTPGQQAAHSTGEPEALNPAPDAAHHPSPDRKAPPEHGLHPGFGRGQRPRPGHRDLPDDPAHPRRTRRGHLGRGGPAQAAGPRAHHTGPPGRRSRRRRTHPLLRGLPRSVRGARRAAEGRRDRGGRTAAHGAGHHSPRHTSSTARRQPAPAARTPPAPHTTPGRPRRLRRLPRRACARKPGRRGNAAVWARGRVRCCGTHSGAWRGSARGGIQSVHRGCCPGRGCRGAAP